MLSQLAEVAGVSLERVLGKGALDTQMVEIRIDPRVKIHGTKDRRASTYGPNDRVAATIDSRSAVGSSRRIRASPMRAASAVPRASSVTSAGPLSPERWTAMRSSGIAA